MPTETPTEAANPRDPIYQIKRQRQIAELLKLSPAQLRQQLKYLMSQPAPRHDGTVAKNAIGELRTSPTIPTVLKGILDSTSGTTGNVLIRQDLEPTLYTYVKLGR